MVYVLRLADSLLYLAQTFPVLPVRQLYESGPKCEVSSDRLWDANQIAASEVFTQSERFAYSYAAGGRGAGRGGESATHILSSIFTVYLVFPHKS